MRTAIFTTKNTKLTIETSEALQLVQKGHEDKPIALERGVNTIDVEAGVFKVVSNNTIRVSANQQDAKFMSTANNKDGEWPDPSGLLKDVARDGLNAFFSEDVKDESAPH
jgi:hypothetical protein